MAGQSKQQANGVRLLPCGCTNKFQDKLYGAGIRAHNAGPRPERRCIQGKDSGKMRGPMKCTACGRVKS